MSHYTEDQAWAEFKRRMNVAYTESRLRIEENDLGMVVGDCDYGRSLHVYLVHVLLPLPIRILRSVGGALWTAAISIASLIVVPLLQVFLAIWLLIPVVVGALVVRPSKARICEYINDKQAEVANSMTEDGYDVSPFLTELTEDQISDVKYEMLLVQMRLH